MTITPEATVAEAIELMQAAGISQLPVLQRRQAGRQHPGGDAGPRPARRPRSRARCTVGEIMARPLPQLDVDVHLDEAYRLLLAGNTGVLATAGGRGRRHRHADRPDPVLEPAATD